MPKLSKSLVVSVEKLYLESGKDFKKTAEKLQVSESTVRRILTSSGRKKAHFWTTTIQRVEKSLKQQQQQPKPKPKPKPQPQPSGLQMAILLANQKKILKALREAGLDI